MQGSGLAGGGCRSQPGLLRTLAAVAGLPSPDFGGQFDRDAGAALGGGCTESGSGGKTRSSWLRESIPSFAETLRKWYWTVCALMNTAPPRRRATRSAKAGCTRCTHNLAIELAPYNIRVNAVAPAVVATPIYERFVTQDKLEETLHSFDSFHPLGRTGTARDLANTITFLPSPATSWVGSALSGRSSSLDGESDGLLT